jgi:4-carboxymuconolactone decarboxylase
MTARPNVTQEAQVANDWSQLNPKLRELTDSVLFGDVWERPGLSKRDRSLITVAMLTALYRTEQLRGHIERALNNGVTKDELIEVITHATFYGGWPTGVNATLAAKQVFEARGI